MPRRRDRTGNFWVALVGVWANTGVNGGCGGGGSGEITRNQVTKAIFANRIRFVGAAVFQRVGPRSAATLQARGCNFDTQELV